jgi:hypothetical protein
MITRFKRGERVNAKWAPIHALEREISAVSVLNASVSFAENLIRRPFPVTGLV